MKPPEYRPGGLTRVEESFVHNILCGSAKARVGPDPSSIPFEKIIAAREDAECRDWPGLSVLEKIFNPVTFDKHPSIEDVYQRSVCFPITALLYWAFWGMFALSLLAYYFILRDVPDVDLILDIRFITHGTVALLMSVLLIHNNLCNGSSFGMLFFFLTPALYVVVLDAFSFSKIIDEERDHYSDISLNQLHGISSSLLVFWQVASSVALRSSRRLLVAVWFTIIVTYNVMAWVHGNEERGSFVASVLFYDCLHVLTGVLTLVRTAVVDHESRLGFIREFNLRSDTTAMSAILDKAFPAYLRRWRPYWQQLEATHVQRYSGVCVVCVDTVGFVRVCDRSSPVTAVNLLRSIFSVLDRVFDSAGMIKARTLSATYTAVCGVEPGDPASTQLPPASTVTSYKDAARQGAHTTTSAAPLSPLARRAVATARAALQVMDELLAVRGDLSESVSLRIGIGSGVCIAGVMSDPQRCVYDLWGKAVTMAHKLQEHGVSGKIQVDVEFRDLLLQATGGSAEAVPYVISVGELRPEAIADGVCATPRASADPSTPSAAGAAGGTVPSYMTGRRKSITQAEFSVAMTQDRKLVVNPQTTQGQLHARANATAAREKAEELRGSTAVEFRRESRPRICAVSVSDGGNQRNDDELEIISAASSPRTSFSPPVLNPSPTGRLARSSSTLRSYLHPWDPAVGNFELEERGVMYLYGIGSVPVFFLEGEDYTDDRRGSFNPGAKESAFLHSRLDVTAGPPPSERLTTEKEKEDMANPSDYQNKRSEKGFQVARNPQRNLDQTGTHTQVSTCGDYSTHIEVLDSSPRNYAGIDTLTDIQDQQKQDLANTHGSSPVTVTDNIMPSPVQDMSGSGTELDGGQTSPKVMHLEASETSDVRRHRKSGVSLRDRRTSNMDVPAMILRPTNSSTSVSTGPQSPLMARGATTPIPPTLKTIPVLLADSASLQEGQQTGVTDR
eukprot:Rmarinus@m.26306